MDCFENNQNYTNWSCRPTEPPNSEEHTSIDNWKNTIHTEYIKTEPLDIEDDNEEMPQDILRVETLKDDSSADNSIKCNESYERKKSDFLGYSIQSDGISVICKRCGKILPSKRHWYRHKEKVHVKSYLLRPSPLIKCEYCQRSFKSRKGYRGHYATRHSIQQDRQEINNGSNPPPTTSISTTLNIQQRDNSGHTENKSNKIEEQQQLDKFVAAIIDRERKECEAQGASADKKGYSRRITTLAC